MPKRKKGEPVGLTLPADTLKRILAEMASNPMYYDRKLANSVTLMLKIYLDNLDKGNIRYGR